MPETFPRTIEEIDPAETYTKGRLQHLRIGRNRSLCEALLNDPCAPRFRADRHSSRVHSHAKLYLGADLIDYMSGVPADWSELERRALDRIAAALEKERAALDKDRQELAEERKNLQVEIERERRRWRDERLQGVRDDVLSALSSSRLRQTVINPVIQRSGVYFLKQQGEIIYCGQSVNMFVRVQQHVGKEFDGVLFFACEPHELNKWEGFFIRLLRPRLNSGCGAADTNAFAPTSELWDRVQVWANDIDEADIPWMAEQSPPPRKRGKGR